ncbi:hypothetical protein IGI04_043030 [Brassica rapa subsp. trilocularis]|uniref:Uncharacterized protein n=1 Tax=Brassica rapa subsp. trilocularis TaxID=1813537 RepID=A0ABQ7KGZ2_BRACM|nr:hypothetical protein IGI04_043030 [Brassica rapa subsp. trilocularis]
MHKQCKDARITSAGLCVHDFPTEGDAANNILSKAKQFLPDRYATQAPDQFNKHKTMLVKKLRRIVGL